MNTTRQISIFGVDLINTTTANAIEILLQPGARRTAVFVNAHCINVAAHDPIYRWALARADHRLPDGSGVQMAAMLTGRRFVENLNGTDLFVPLCRAAADRGLPIYFLGSAHGVAAGAADRAVEIAPGLITAGARDGYFQRTEEDRIIADVNASGAEIVLVALGVPKQDIWIARNRHRLRAGLVLGVGAQFDFWSGRVPRAPLFLRKAGLEWLMRLAVEPRRMARRYLLGNLEFTFAAVTGRSVGVARGVVRARTRRFLDLVVSTSALLTLSPVFLLIGAAIRLESPGPALSRTARVGKDGRAFKLYKFRSISGEAEAKGEPQLRKSGQPGLRFGAKPGPRVTGVGRFLRRFSLDGLPQLINVLRGDMAMVGPRPALPQEVAVYSPQARLRLATKPGLTGLWQIGGRAEIGFNKMVEMDSAHVGARSVLLDIMIMALTVRALIGGRRAG